MPRFEDRWIRKDATRAVINNPQTLRDPIQKTEMAINNKWLETDDNWYDSLDVGNLDTIQLLTELSRQNLQSNTQNKQIEIQYY